MKKATTKIMTLAALALALIGLSILTLTSMFAPVAAVRFTAKDVTISSDDGQIKSVTISPKGTFSWSGLDEDVQFDGDDQIVYNIYVKLNDGDWGLLYSAVQSNYKNIEDKGTTGYDNFVFQPIELKKPNLIAYWQMEADEDGTKKVSKISVKIEAKLQTSDVIDGVTKWRDLVTASNTVTFYLTCINEKATADFGCDLNVAAEPTPDT